MPSANERLQIILAEYNDSHQDPLNILIHKICVPLIMFSLLGILKSIPTSHFDCSLILFVGAMGYYASFRNFNVVASMLLFVFPMYVVLNMLRYHHLFLTSLIIFVLAWIGQFVGHKIEGKKPSFLKDLQFLLIGPLWVIKALWPDVF
jgi:uncharacterized membrane protein YGL010W